MAKSRRRSRKAEHRPRGGWPGRSSGSLLDRVGWLRGGFLRGVKERYNAKVDSDLRGARLSATVPVQIPVYGDRCELRIVIVDRSTSVFVDRFPGRLHHTFGNNRLCMWHPSDPPDRVWTLESGLLALIDMAVVHLFRERYYIDHPEEGWPGEEAPHPSGTPKLDDPGT